MIWLGRSTSGMGCARGTGLELRREGIGAAFARTAGPPPVAHGEQPVHGPHHHVPKPAGPPTGLIVGLVAAGVAGIILLVGILASRQQAPTLAELRAKLGIPATGLPANFKISQVDFINALGTPYHKEEDPSYVYLYYTIQEGTAIIVVDRGGWDMSGEARIRQISTR